jgi:hypothetical protein
MTNCNATTMQGMIPPNALNFALILQKNGGGGGEVTQILTLRHCIVVVLIQFLVSHLSSLGFWLFNSLLEASHSLYLFMYCYGYVAKVLY